MTPDGPYIYNNENEFIIGNYKNSLRENLWSYVTSSFHRYAYYKNNKCQWDVTYDPVTKSIHTRWFD